jgi:hypothetical protein
MSALATPWIDVAIELDGERLEGRYTVRDACWVTVLHAGRTKGAMTGASGPGWIARALLAELARESRDSRLPRHSHCVSEVDLQ